MMKSLFQWLDQHPDSFWYIACVASLLLVARLGRVLVRDFRETGTPPRPDWRDGLVLLVFLLAWRWPFLLIANDNNPDESQLIAGALTLARDPVFWRSVDGGSSGPLNYYVLVPWAWLGAPLDFFTGRLTALLLTWGALFATLRTLAAAFGRVPAWLGLLPAAAFFATVGHPDFTGLSTEHLPLCLIAIASNLLAGRAPGDRFRLRAACLIAGALPWTKLQTVPIGLALIAWAGWQILREPGVTWAFRWRQVRAALLAGALPSLLLAAMVIVTGETETAVQRYFLQNFFYVSNSSSGSLAEAMASLWHNSQADGRLPLLLYTALAGLVAAAAYFALRRVRPSGLLVAAGWIVLVSLAAVVTPRRDYLHYALLLPVPVTLWFGAALGGWWRHVSGGGARLLLAAVFLAAGLVPLITRAFQPVPPIYGSFVYHWRHPRTSAAAVAHALAGRGDSLGLWGWASFLNVETGLPQATREGNTGGAIDEGSQQNYYRAGYLADLKKSAPAVFIDAVGLGSFKYTNRAQGHEMFPELADYVRANYTLVVDLPNARVYARRGLAARRELDEARLAQLVNSGRQEAQVTLAPPNGTLNLLQQKFVGARKVVMLLPPVQVEWLLDPDVREVWLEFGFDPAADGPGKSNGVELTLEITDATSTQPVYHRFLDPARQPGDLGPHQVRLELPPFAAGSKLVLRTDPGQFGDTAWDWIYLAGLRLHHAADLPPK